MQVYKHTQYKALKCIERVMRCLKKTHNLELYYQNFPAILEGYSDSDWNFLLNDSKTTNSYVFDIASGVVAWKSKTHTILAQSTIESKMIVLAIINKKASWLRSLLFEIFICYKPVLTILIHCNGTVPIANVQNRFYNRKR